MRISAYVYQADLICTECVLNALGYDNLDDAALAMGVIRTDESSYDSYDFPKVVFESDLDGYDVCGTCFGELE